MTVKIIYKHETEDVSHMVVVTGQESVNDKRKEELRNLFNVDGILEDKASRL